MKDHIRAFRYLAGALAICAALNLVSFAQQAAGAAMRPKVVTATADPVAKLVTDWTRARDYTKEYLDAMPEEGLSFKPTPDIRSFAEQMLHLANANFLFISTATGATNPQQGKNLEKMDEPIKLFNRFDATRGVALEKAFEHQTHHRGQTTIYLRLKGVTPPGEKLF